jgi:hypothetical protein
LKSCCSNSRLTSDFLHCQIGINQTQLLIIQGNRNPYEAQNVFFYALATFWYWKVLSSIYVSSQVIGLWSNVRCVELCWRSHNIMVPLLISYSNTKQNKQKGRLL